jgi:hypothetical protein
MHGLDFKQSRVFEQRDGTVVPCGRGIAWFFGDLLWTCRIDRHATIQGHDFPADAELWFRGDGTLERASYIERKEALVHSEDHGDTRVMSFDPSGKVTSSTVEARHGLPEARKPATRFEGSQL